MSKPQPKQLSLFQVGVRGVAREDSLCFKDIPRDPDLVTIQRINKHDRALASEALAIEAASKALKGLRGRPAKGSGAAFVCSVCMY